MTMAAPNRAKIPTDSPQLVRNGARQSALRATFITESPQLGRGRAGGAPRAKKGGALARPKVLATGTGRDSTRGGGGEVIELECGVTVYPARSEGGRWRAVWYEAGARQQCEAATEEKLAPKLEKVVERLQSDAPNMRRPGADLIAHYLDPDRLPVHNRWSRKHTDTQRRLCERFAAPVIAAVTCQDIKLEHTQKIVNAAPTAGEGDRVHRMLSALVSAGIDAGYLAALTIAQVNQAARVITVDRKVVEVGGRLYVEAPKNRKFRRTIYPRRAPGGYPLAERLAARIDEARAEHEAGSNPLGLIFPSRRGGYWRSSNYNRRILQPAYVKAGWRNVDGNGTWTWHSLRHVFCTTALFTWKLEPTDVSRMAGHANYRITLDMYVGATAGVLDRARAATE